MRNENAADIYAEEQMPQEIREKIAALESVGQAKLIPKAQHELKGSIECALDTGKISAGTCAYLKAHFFTRRFFLRRARSDKLFSFTALVMPSVGQACRSAVRQTISASAFTVQRIWNLLKSGLASAEGAVSFPATH